MFGMEIIGFTKNNYRNPILVFIIFCILLLIHGCQNGSKQSTTTAQLSTKECPKECEISRLIESLSTSKILKDKLGFKDPAQSIYLINDQFELPVVIDNVVILSEKELEEGELHPEFLWHIIDLDINSGIVQLAIYTEYQFSDEGLDVKGGQQYDLEFIKKENSWKFLNLESTRIF